ncbi:MAG: hypothetical protein KDE27_24795 [Planctomycetes bacterium]|nr:hypothetical protein [Planctomycetota bacterium]
MEQLAAALKQASTPDQLIELDKTLAVLKEASQRFEVAIEEAIRIASFDLMTKRKIGASLMQLSQWGGDRARVRDVHLLDRFHRELGTGKVRRYRELAQIGDADFNAYISDVSARREIPTAAGARRHAARSVGRTPRMPRGPSTPRTSPVRGQVLTDVLGAGIRLFGQVDVLVGDAQVRAAVRIPASRLRVADLRGRVLAVECPDPKTWIPRITALRSSTRLDEALVLLPARTGSDWFATLALSDWVCCFLKHAEPLLVAYLGVRKAGFIVAFQPLGVVMRAQAG